MHLVAGDRQLEPDRDEPLLAVRVEVEVVDGLPRAVLKLRDPRPGQPLDIVLDLARTRPRRCPCRTCRSAGTARDSAIRVASICAWQSPMMSSGERELEAIIAITSSRVAPRSTTRTGGMRTPSPKWSVAPTSNEPGTDAADVGPVAVRLRERDHLAVGEQRAG